MVAYQDFVALSESRDSEERGMAAHLAARAYLAHSGPPDEHAALYAALIGFLDDPSVKVRAALAYGLLHAADAPRPILMALLQDSAVISRAVVQYSPALLDVDLLAQVRSGDLAMLAAIAMRDTLSQRVAEAIAARGERSITLKLLGREDVTLSPGVMMELIDRFGSTDPEVRGALLARPDLPPAGRLQLVHAAAEAMAGLRIVKGAVAPNRLERLLRDGKDTALTSIGERSAAIGDQGYTAVLIAAERVSTRIMLHAVVNGHVLFFADCVAALSEVPREKVFTILEHGSRPALNALLARCGLGEGVRNLFARLIFHARTADLADDVTARHFVITTLTEELIVDHDGHIPHDLEDAFSYLCEQNVLLARRAANGVMGAFAGNERGEGEMPVPETPDDDQLSLPAA